MCPGASCQLDAHAVERRSIMARLANLVPNAAHPPSSPALSVSASLPSNVVRRVACQVRIALRHWPHLQVKQSPDTWEAK